jgi:Tol biopolymer transport system component
MSFANSEWSEPVHLDAPVNSPFRELAAALSPDELSIYFGSDRPDPTAAFGAIDMWVSHRACLDCPWEEPVNLGANINSPQGDGSPAFSPDGHLLFFTSGRDGGAGGDDIWVTHRTDTNDDLGWEPAVNLGPYVNTAAAEVSPSYIPAIEGGGVNLYFSRGTDVYAVRVTSDGEALGPAEPVAGLGGGRGVTVRKDGREVYFWSNPLNGMGGSDIFVATRRSPNDEWSAPENVGPVINTSFADLTPSLSLDGRTLLFSEAAAARPGLGLQDIWMSTRTPSGN